MTRRFIRDNGLSIAVMSLFLIFLGAQAWVGWVDFNNDRQDHSAPTVTFARYLASGDFGEAVFENWESEFLQMGLYVILAEQKMRNALQGSAYADGGLKVAELLKHTKGAPPKVIAHVVSRALKTSRPRRRYAAPFDAKAMIFLVSVLPTCMWEGFIQAILKAYARQIPAQG